MGSHSANPFEVVLFDLGSTLIYFDGQWPQVIQNAHSALLQSLVENGIQLEEASFLNSFRQRLEQYFEERDTEFIELTMSYILRTLLAELGFTDIRNEVIQQALAEMYAVSQAHWKAEKDAIPTLQMLQQRGYRLGLISNAADDTDVQTLVDRAGLRAYFDVILTSAAQGIRKPNPQIFYRALKHWEVAPRQAAMVGDTLGADILGAENAGIYSIWITRRADTPGNRAHMDTIRPQAVIDSLSELPDLLNRLEIGE
ncbi:MAG: HAD family hydrolase [Anaerolineales bacterium]|nr:MAG: HAD family hydrolase [Anaerolineales bacterium]